MKRHECYSHLATRQSVYPVRMNKNLVLDYT